MELPENQWLALARRIIASVAAEQQVAARIAEAWWQIVVCVLNTPGTT